MQKLLFLLFATAAFATPTRRPSDELNPFGDDVIAPNGLNEVDQDDYWLESDDESNEIADSIVIGPDNANRLIWEATISDDYAQVAKVLDSNLAKPVAIDLSFIHACAKNYEAIVRLFVRRSSIHQSAIDYAFVSTVALFPDTAIWILRNAELSENALLVVLFEAVERNDLELIDAILKQSKGLDVTDAFVYAVKLDRTDIINRFKAHTPGLNVKKGNIRDLLQKHRVDRMAILENHAGFKEAAESTQFPSVLSHSLIQTNPQDDLPASEVNGMQNPGRLSHMNAVLQSLYHFPGFQAALEEIDSDSDLINSLRDVMRQLAMKSMRPADGSRFAREFNVLRVPICGARMETDKQYDAYAFLSCLLTILKVLSPELKEHITALFDGESVKRFQGPYNRFEPVAPFNFLSAPLNLGDNSLIGVLDDMYPLNAHENFVKKIKGSPRVLGVHIERFRYSNALKVNFRFEFPLRLDITPFMDDPTVIVEYQLHSVIVHEGSAKNGHYWTALQSANKWIKCHDEKCSLIPDIQQTLLDVYGDGTPNDQPVAHILFYARA